MGGEELIVYGARILLLDVPRGPEEFILSAHIQISPMGRVLVYCGRRIVEW